MAMTDYLQTRVTMLYLAALSLLLLGGLLPGCSSSGSQTLLATKCQDSSECPRGYVCDDTLRECRQESDLDPDDESATEGDAETAEGDTEESDAQGCDPALPCLSVPEKIDFGSVPYGDTSKKTFSISNSGTLPVTLHPYEILPTPDVQNPAFVIDSGSYDNHSDLVLNPGDPALVWTATFHRYNAANSEAELRIYSNQQNGRWLPVQLIAYEKGVAKLSAEPAAGVVFGETSVRQQAYLPFTLINTPVPENSADSRTLEIESITLSGPFLSQTPNGETSGSGCYGTMVGNDRFLGKKARRACRIQFSPLAAQDYQGELLVTYKDQTNSQSRQLVLPLTGRGIQPLLEASPKSFCDGTTFKNVTQNFERRGVFSVVNSSPGSDTLNILAARIEPAEGPFSLTFLPKAEEEPTPPQSAPDAPPINLARGRGWSVFVDYRPTALGATENQALILETNAAGYTNGRVSIPLCGNAIAASDAVVGLVLGVPALGRDNGQPATRPASCRWPTPPSRCRTPTTPRSPTPWAASPWSSRKTCASSMPPLR